MLRKARERLPKCKFHRGRYRHLDAAPGTDLIFANAVMQWLPDHPAICGDYWRRWRRAACWRSSCPTIRASRRSCLQREVGESGPWADHPEMKAAPRDDLPTPEEYYDLLKPACSHIDIWHSIYNHVMASPQAITEWFKGSSLQPFLSPLDAADAGKISRRLYQKIVGAYKPRFDGKVLLGFPRLFIVAVR